MGVRGIIFLMGAVLLLQGCRTVVSKPVSVPVKQEAIHVFYPVANELEVKVTFESPKAYDTTQLGLLLLNKTNKDEKVLKVSDPEFFPKYFTIVNTDIKDGLLFISDQEGDEFSRRVFLLYQKQVMPKEIKPEVRWTRTLQGSRKETSKKKESPDK